MAIPQSLMGGGTEDPGHYGVIELREGAMFDSFDALMISVKRWEKANFVNLSRRCSRTIEVAKKRAPSRTFKPSLQYFELDFACVYGGRKHKPNIKIGTRPKRGTLLKDCPFRVLVRATDDGERLYVKKIDKAATHCHELCHEDKQVQRRSHSVPKARTAGGSAKSPLTTHVLDTARGSPAAHLRIEVYYLMAGQWKKTAQGRTNSDGRCPGLLTVEQFIPGVYKIFFDTGSYFTSNNIKGFYPFVEIVFEIEDVKQHYHVPLLLSPFSYSTYRGS